MERHLRLAASVAAFLLVAGPVSAEIYRWTDESGNTHFTGDLSQVPARYRAQAANPDESKSTFNSAESSDSSEPSSAGDAPSQPTTTSSPAAQPRASSTPTHKPIPRIRTRGGEPSQPRMAEFEAQEKAEEAASRPAPSGPKKYIRDCEDPTRRCKSWVNPEWVAENEAKKAREAAAEAEE